MTQRTVSRHDRPVALTAEDSAAESARAVAAATRLAERHGVRVSG